MGKRERRRKEPGARGHSSLSKFSSEEFVCRRACYIRKLCKNPNTIKSFYASNFHQR